MGYCIQSDIEGAITAPRVEELSKPEGVGIVIPRVVTDADAEIDMHETGAWTADWKRACSIALAVEGLYARHGTGKVPRVHADRAATWRLRLDTAGQKSSKAGTWSGIAYDPVLRESAAELDRIQGIRR